MRQEQRQRTPPTMDFELLSEFRAAPASGANRTMFEFPSLVPLSDGRLFTVFIEENQHGTPPWAAMPGSGRLWCAWSADAGKTWTERQPFVDTPVDDRHSYVTQLPDGTLLATFWVQLVAFGARGVLNFVTFSGDNGLTWSDPRRFRGGNRCTSARDQPLVQGSCSVTVPARLHADGRLYLPVATVGHDGRPPSEAGLMWSGDGGRTWGDYVTAAFDPERRISFCEPAIICTQAGRWIAVMRTERPINPGTTHPYELGPTMWCTSDDAKTWSEPREMPLDFTTNGSTAPFLVETGKGVVVFAVNTGLAFSYDAGLTWTPQDLRCGYYPVLAELAPNTLASLACGMQGSIVRLTKPEPGKAAQSSAVPVPVVDAVPLPAPVQPEVKVLTVTSVPRVLRLRGALAADRSPLVRPDPWPVLAVFAAKTERGRCVAGVFGSHDEAEWTDPFLIAPTQGTASAVSIGSSADGVLLAVCNWRSGSSVDRPLVVRSRAGGRTWESVARLDLQPPPSRQGEPGIWEPGGDPVGISGRRWLLPCTFRPLHGLPVAAILASDDDGVTWRFAAAMAEALHEPALAVARDGRWLVLARQTASPDIVQCVSSDRGATWSEPVSTGMRGVRPAVVELLESFFVAGFESGDGPLSGGVSWDGLDHWLSRHIACGHLVRVHGRKYIGLGSGVDLAGEFGRSAQVPLDPGEIAAAEDQQAKSIPCTSGAFAFDGDWEKGQDGGQTRFVCRETGTVKVNFTGHTLFLVHGTCPDGHILKITIDGEEYPPVETQGDDAFPVRTCLAVGLSPGLHTLGISPMLPWRTGRTVIGGIEIVREY